MKRLRFASLIAAGMLLILSSQFSAAHNNPPTTLPATNRAQQDILQPPETITATTAAGTRLWNLQDADILSIINEVSQETGKNFVVDPRVNGKITLISSKPIAKDEVYDVFLSILGALVYSAIPSNGVINIVPNIESAEMAARVATDKAPGKGQEVVVRVIPLENISATQVIASIRPLLPQWSNISAYAPGNVLILTGRAGNLRRIIQLIQEVDKTTNNTIEVIPLHHASATQVSTVLSNLQNAARATGEGQGLSIAVDERSNNIILSGTKAARIKMRLLISQLDAPATVGAGNTEVVYLRYLKAKEMAPLLSRVALNMMGKNSSDNSAASPTQAVTGASKNSAANTAQTNIQAELSTNALIVTAPTSIMQALKSVIARLDVRPAQVLIEAVIAEIDEGDIKNLGIQWGTLTQPGNLSSFSPADGELPTNFPIPGAGNIGIIPNIQIRAVLSILENINGANILSTPSIVVLDNHKASIEVGQDVPQQTGSFSTPPTTGGQISPFNTFDRRRVTLQLDVVPQINLGNAVRLGITLKNDSLRNPDNPGTNPLINISKIKNDVIVNSDNVLVLGGLISNTLNENINKVPLLGDIPLLGLAFQQKSRSLSKKILIVFIKPIILRNAEEGTVITHTKYDAIRQTQINEPREFKKIGKQVPPNVLPPWGSSVELPRPFEG